MKEGLNLADCRTEFSVDKTLGAQASFAPTKEFIHADDAPVHHDRFVIAGRFRNGR